MALKKWITMTSTSDFRCLFVDSSAWLALMNAGDAHHDRAIGLHESIRQPARYLTSLGIVAETYTWIRYHIGADAASRWISLKDGLIRSRVLEIVFPEPADLPATEAILLKFSDQRLSFVDAFSILAVRARPEVDGIFAFDRHLSLAGRPVVPASL